MRILCFTLVLGVLASPIFSGPVHAKRAAPAFISPIRADGKIFRDIFENDEADKGYSVYLTAEDPGDHSTIWKTKLYSNAYDTGMETDVQEVHLRSLKLDGGVLVATDEGGHVYKVNANDGVSEPAATSRASVPAANCPLDVKVGKYVGSRRQKIAHFGDRPFCFRTDTDQFTDKTPLDEVKKKFGCIKDAMMDPGANPRTARWYIHCTGVDLEVTGKPSAYKLVGLRIRPLGPKTE